MVVELEKDDRIKRSRKIIVSGLVPQVHTADNDVFNSFRENNLTVKPHLMSCHRVGKPTATRLAKLKISLDNSQAVDYLIVSSPILRQSVDATIRNVYFNKDLTKMEAQAAYEERQRRRCTNNVTGHAEDTSPPADI